MAYEFVRRPDGSVMCRLDPEEKAIVAQVAQEVADLIRLDLGWDDAPTAVRRAADSDDPLERLEAEFATSIREPHDSAVQRLLPVCSSDSAVDQEMRRLGQHDLVSLKLANLRQVTRSIDSAGPIISEIVLDPDGAQSWLKALTDMRLVLADRLSLRSDDDIDTLRTLNELGLAGGDSDDSASPGAPGGASDQGADAHGVDAPTERPAPMNDGAEIAGPDLVLAVYDLLTWLQESLVHALSRSASS